MSLSIESLLELSDFFLKKATIEEDMAKRIMLSIIPGVSSPLEMQTHKGFDYKALRSAVNGTKDLIKYGTKACVEEVGNYGDPAIEQVYGSGSQENVKALYKGVYNNAEDLWKAGRYGECLQVCIKAFLDDKEGAWAGAYGGKAWAKIAKILSQMQEKRELLDYIRQDANSPNRDPNTDYLDMEMQTMKDIVVLMNIFDGLAHNTASVMPKVIQEERHALNMPSEMGHKYQERVQELMDAKELDNPLVVYKQVQHIIENSPSKYMFKDWIQRIKEHPDFSKTKSHKETLNDMALIRIKKNLKNKLNHLSDYADKIGELKDVALRSNDLKAVEKIYGSIRQNLNYIDDVVYDIVAIFNDALREFPQLYTHLLQKSATARKELNKYITNHVVAMRDKLFKLTDYIDNEFMTGSTLAQQEILINARKFYSDIDLISDIHNLKRNIAAVSGIIEQLI